MKKLIVGLLTMMVFASAAYADVIIIANKDVPDDVLSRKDVEEIYLGKRVQWSNYSKIRFVTVKAPDVHKAFLRQYLNKTEAKYDIYWKRMVFTGRGIPPKSIGTEAEVIAYVAETSGAVGYVSSDGIPRNVRADIKIIRVR